MQFIDKSNNLYSYNLYYSYLLQAILYKKYVFYIKYYAINGGKLQ